MNECKCKECGKIYMQFESKALKDSIYCGIPCEVKNQKQLSLFEIEIKEV